jgi:hypothetical protein
LRKFFGVALACRLAGAAAGGAIVAIGATGFEPGVEVVHVAQAVGGFDLPDEARHVVAGAGPIGGHDAGCGAGGNAAIVGDFAEVKTVAATAAADLHPGARQRRSVAAIVFVLPRRIGGKSDRRRVNYPKFCAGLFLKPIEPGFVGAVPQ